MATDLATLTREQIDALLRTHVREREEAQDAMLCELDIIDAHTRRIAELIDARCTAAV